MNSQDFDEFEKVISHDEIINNFINDEGYNILLFSEDLKKRVFNYFLDKMNYTELMAFILDQKFEAKLIPKFTDKKLCYLFQDVYRQEINTTLFVLNNFLAKLRYNKLQVSENDWINFCLQYTSSF